MGIALCRDRVVPSRSASSERPSSIRWEHSTSSRYARQVGLPSGRRAAAGPGARPTGRPGRRARRARPAASDVPRPCPRRSPSVGPDRPPGPRWRAARAGGRQPDARRARPAAAGRWPLDRRSRVAGPAAPADRNGLLVATNCARTRAVRTGSVSPSRASASTHSWCTRSATAARVVVRMTVAASARLATSPVRRASAATRSQTSRASGRRAPPRIEVARVVQELPSVDTSRSEK